MSVLHSQFDYKLCQDSPYVVDYRRVCNFDKDGVEIVTFVEKDFPSIVKSHGKVSDWSLTSMIKAGIDPKSLHVNTSAITNLDNFNDMSAWNQVVDDVLNESKES